MKYLIRKYYSGYCEHEIEVDNEDEAWEKSDELPPIYDEIIASLEDWEECNEVELV